jgi:hypothetical protein
MIRNDSTTDGSTRAEVDVNRRLWLDMDLSLRMS